jgi:hypothetical protein
MRKKKRKQLPPLTMDENNDVFDMDFWFLWIIYTMTIFCVSIRTY